jgi:hypothetical protein
MPFIALSRHPPPPLLLHGQFTVKGWNTQKYTHFCDGHAKLFRNTQPYHLCVICFKILKLLSQHMALDTSLGKEKDCVLLLQCVNANLTKLGSSQQTCRM